MQVCDSMTTFRFCLKNVLCTTKKKLRASFLTPDEMTSGLQSERPRATKLWLKIRADRRTIDISIFFHRSMGSSSATGNGRRIVLLARAHPSADRALRLDIRYAPGARALVFCCRVSSLRRSSRMPVSPRSDYQERTCRTQPEFDGSWEYLKKIHMC